MLVVLWQATEGVFGRVIGQTYHQRFFALYLSEPQLDLVVLSVRVKRDFQTGHRPIDLKVFNREVVPTEMGAVATTNYDTGLEAIGDFWNPGCHRVEKFDIPALPILNLA